MERWSETNLRDLPWRHTRDAWAVLVSEVMLQQTQVDRVIPKYLAFLEEFPTVSSCAAEDVAAVIRHWDGLGYNRRAVYLWRSAVAIVDLHDGVVPDRLEALLGLPGVGTYTAHAVLAQAFEQEVGVVDTNIGRLLARWHGEALSAREAQSLADYLVPEGQAWRWTQSLFDFAATQCTKRDPDCSACVVRVHCRWRGAGADPAASSAGVSKPQSRFSGSEREVRGAIVRALRAGPLPIDSISHFANEHHGPETVRRLIRQLIDEGLVEHASGQLRLPRSA